MQIEDQILDCFRPVLKNHIIEFCKHLSSLKADVFILLARKAACFIDVLQARSFVKLYGTVVSERVLDLNTDWLKNKTVVIVDDTIISGTTIHDIISKLVNIGVGSISVQVFCIDKEWFKPELLINQTTNENYLKTPFLELEHAESLEFCKNIVEMLSIYPRPYSIDFPLFEGVDLYENQIERLLKSSQWCSDNTTTTLQERKDILTFTLVPTDKERAYKYIGEDLCSLVYIKLRVYGKRFDADKRHITPNKEKNRFKCRILPIVIFNHLSTSNLDAIFLSICKAENLDFHKLNYLLLTNTSRMLLIQYYLACRLMLYFKTFMEEDFKINIKLNTPTGLEYLFSPEIISIIDKFSYSTIIEKILNKETNNNSLNSYDENKKYFAIKNDIKKIDQENPYIIESELKNIFLYLYYKEELPARLSVRDNGKDCFKKDEYLTKRLLRGVSFQEMKYRISGIVNDELDQDLIISNFLDRAIDAGLVVPITVDCPQSKFVFRGYRHGEEVVWGESEDKLIAVFFYAFFKEYNYIDTGNRESYLEKEKSLLPQNIIKNLQSHDSQTAFLIPKFWFEKLCVLFVKMGVNAKFLTSIDTTSSYINTSHLVSVRSYLHGEILVDCRIENNKIYKHTPIIDSNDRGYWMSERMRDLSTLDESGFYPGRLFNQQRNLNNFKEEIKEDLGDNNYIDVIMAAQLLAKLNKQGILKEDQIIQLTSCYTIRDIVASLGAEINVFRTNRNDFIGTVRTKISRGKISLEEIEMLKKKIVWIAINSGFMKYSCFKRKNVNALLEQISDSFETNFQISKWEELYPKTYQAPNATPALYSLNDELGSIIIELLVILRKLFLALERLYYLNQQDGNTHTLLSAFFASQKKASRAIEKAYQLYLTANLNPTKEEIELFTIEELDKIASVENLCNYIHNDLLAQLASYEKNVNYIMEELFAIISEWGKYEKNVTFLSLLKIIPQTDNVEEINRINSITNSLFEDFERLTFPKPSNSIKSVAPLRVKSNELKCIYFGAKGKLMNERLINFTVMLLKAQALMGLSVKMHLYLNLSAKNAINTIYDNQKNQYEVLPDFDAAYFPTDFKAKGNLQIFQVSDDPLLDLIQESLIKNHIIFHFNSINIRNLNYKNMYDISIENCTELPQIGIVTILPEEFSAMRMMLDDAKMMPTLPDDPLNYCIGYISSKKEEKRFCIVLCMLKEMGENDAATCTTHMIRTFKNITHILVCGIAGGIPNPNKVDDHVRLGDIVVSTNILQYDLVKDAGNVQIRSNTPKPSSDFMGLVKILEVEAIENRYPWYDYIKKGIELNPKFMRPDNNTDILYIDGKQINHPIDALRKESRPKVFKGAIGSANVLLKNEDRRDYLRDNYDLKAVEMEAAGVADGTWMTGKSYFMIRGIADYCNSQKNDKWHFYSSLAAASYTKALIELL